MGGARSLEPPSTPQDIDLAPFSTSCRTTLHHGLLDHYRTCGLTHTADAAAIRSAYRRLAKEYHPDVSTRSDAHARFIAITEAYEVLSDVVARDKYDRTRQSPSPKRASPHNEARYARDTEARQRAARAHAEEYSRMRYAQFDADVFDSVAGYVVPKMLGCVGIGVVAIIVLVLLMILAGDNELLAIPVVLLALFGFIPGVAYASTMFDGWHNERQVRRRRAQR